MGAKAEGVAGLGVQWQKFSLLDSVYFSCLAVGALPPTLTSFISIWFLWSPSEAHGVSVGTSGKEAGIQPLTLPFQAHRSPSLSQGEPKPSEMPGLPHSPQSLRSCQPCFSSCGLSGSQLCSDVTISVSLSVTSLFHVYCLSPRFWTP